MEKIFNWVLDNWGKIVAFVERFFDILAEVVE